MATSTSTSTLIAAGGNPRSALDLGYVRLTYDSITGDLRLTYHIEDATPNDSRDDWLIQDIHFDIGATLDAIPTTKAGNPKVGLFDYSGSSPGASFRADRSEFTLTISNVQAKDVRFWAAHASVYQRDAITAFNESLPDSVMLQVAYPSTDGNSLFTARISGSREAWLNGAFQGWCVDTDAHITPGQTYSAKVYSSLREESLIGVIDKWNNMNAVNWLLNHFTAGDSLADELAFKGANAAFIDYANGGPLASDSITGSGTGADLGRITYGDIQRAVWALVEDDIGTGESALGPYSASRADELADRAFLYGHDYVPPCNGKAAVVYRPIHGNSTSAQAIISPVTIASPTGSCQGREETAWAINGGISGLTDGRQGFSRSTWAEYNTFSL